MKLLKDLEKQIEKDFGKPCKDKSILCANCIAYGHLNALKELYEN